MLSTGLLLGAEHAILQDAIHSVEQGKAKRSMFAETQREREEMLESIKNSDWNMEMNPVMNIPRCPVVTLHDFSKG